MISGREEQIERCTVAGQQEWAGHRSPPLPQSSLCHHLDAILKPSAPAPHVNKGMTPNMLASLNELFLAAAEPQNGRLCGVTTGTRMAGITGEPFCALSRWRMLRCNKRRYAEVFSKWVHGGEVSARTHTEWMNKGMDYAEIMKVV